MNDDGQKATFVRALGLWDCVLYVVGSIVGTGIFLSAGVVAKKVPHPTWILAAWVLGALHALAAGFTYAELGARRPEAGGAYVYISETFGALPAYLYNWSMSFVVFPGTVAAISVGFAEYLGVFFPSLGTGVLAFHLPFGVPVSVGQMVAVATGLGLSVWNVLGIKEGGALNDVLTVIKIGAAIAIAFFGLTAARSHLPSFAHVPFSAGLLGSFGGALAAVLWSYDGWINMSSIAGEVKNPKRDLPGGLLIGIGIVAALYLSVNVVYLSALTVDEIGATPRVAETAMQALYGSAAAKWISAAVLISVFGALVANIIPAPRIAYATARDGRLPEAFGRLHPRYATPAFGLMFQGIWGAVLTLSGSFDQLVGMIAFSGTLFYALGGAALFVYRRRQPDAPYLCPGYPVVPAVYVGASALFALAIILDAPKEAAKGLAILALGVVVFLWQERSRGNNR